MKKARGRTLPEYTLFGVLSLAIAWWFFGSAAFAAWMTAFYSDGETVRI